LFLLLGMTQAGVAKRKLKASTAAAVAMA
jgi:hypothetical protein